MNSDIGAQDGPSRETGFRPASPLHPSLRVFWLLWGDRSVGSSRVNGYMVHEWLMEHGVSSTLLLAPSRLVPDIPWTEGEHRKVAQLVGRGIVVFQKVAGPHTEHLISVLREAGASTVFVQGDYYPEVHAPFLCDAVVCDSMKLIKYHREGGARDLAYIPDTIDFACVRSDIARRPRRSRGLRVCWHGSPERWGEFSLVKQVLQEPEFADMQLVTVSGHPEATIKWSVARLRKAMRECDIGLVPRGSWAEAVYKPSDRVVQFMASGVPVIAERIPSYEEIIVPGETGYLADTKEEYRKALRALRDPEVRRRIALRAHDLVQEQFTRDATGRKWVALFRSLMAAKRTDKPIPASLSRKELRLLNNLIVRAKIRHGVAAVNHGRYLYAAKDFGAACSRILLHPGVLLDYVAAIRRTVGRGERAIARRIAGHSKKAMRRG